MQLNKHDIIDKTDITELVDQFYTKVLENEILKPHFKGLDFASHKPKMVHFWSFVLLNEPGYTTNVFDKHKHLHIDKTHFAEWLRLFNQTVDDLFDGEKANDVKSRATVLAWTFGEKMSSHL